MCALGHIQLQLGSDSSLPKLHRITLIYEWNILHIHKMDRIEMFETVTEYEISHFSFFLCVILTILRFFLKEDFRSQKKLPHESPESFRFSLLSQWRFHVELKHLQEEKDEKREKVAMFEWKYQNFRTLESGKSCRCCVECLHSWVVFKFTITPDFFLYHTQRSRCNYFA